MQKKLSFWLLIMATYAMVSGGAFGLEGMIGSAGYGYSILILLFLPLFWSLPVGLLVAEQAAAMPAEGGIYVWSRWSLGSFWGFQHAWLVLAASIFDMGIYCNLFARYIGSMFPSLGGEGCRIALGLIVVLVGLIFNIRGARSVAWSSVGFTLALWIPFVLLVGWVIVHRLLSGETPSVSENIGTISPFEGVLVAMWNLMGWDNASTVAGEVERPQRTYLHVMLGAVFLVSVSYLIPVATMSITGEPYTNWVEGHWVVMAKRYGGWPLGGAMMLAAMLSAVSVYNALVMSYTRLVEVLARDGWLPKFLAKKNNESGAPVAAIVCCSLLWAVSLTLEIKKLLAIDIMFYGLSLIIGIVALITLRIRVPESVLQRPFKIPGGVPVLVIMFIPLVLLVGATLYHNRSEVVWGMSALKLGMIVVVVGIIRGWQCRKHVPKWEGE